MTQANPNANTRTGQPKLALHSTAKPAKSNVASRLFELIKTGGEPEKVIKQLLLISIAETGARSSQLLVRRAGRWQFKPGAKVGKHAAELDLLEELDEELDGFFQSGNTVLRTLASCDDQPVTLTPIRAAACEPEILIQIHKDQSNAAKAFSRLRPVVDALSIWMERQYVSESVWQVSSLASIVELVGKIESSATIKDASNSLVNELTRGLGCETVAIAVYRKGKLAVQAISGLQKVDSTSKTCLAYLQALQESTIRDQQAIYPAMDSENDHLLIAHKQLAATIQNEAVISQTLVNTNGDTVGAWVFTGNRNLIQNERMNRFVSTASPSVADSCSILARSQKPWLTRAVRWMRDTISGFTWLMMLLGVIGLILLMALPITYRVRCNCVIEPVKRRYAVAPFDGLIVSGYAEPGDLVKKGEVLAEIDGRTIRWELSSVTAERLSSLRQREIELADENIPNLFLAELENERFSAEESILNFKKDNLKIKSPIDGVILSGSLERSEASSVTTGEVLFEVGSTKEIKVQIEIPADEIAQIDKGQHVKIWIEGNEDTPLSAEITRLHPRSITRDAKNVFIAEVEFENPEDRYRPGMKGVVRIDGHERSLGWSLFHKPVNYVRSHFTWW